MTPTTPATPTTITEQDLARLEKLARLAVAAADRPAIQNDLNRMMALIAELQAVDTSGVIPMAHPLETHQDVTLRLRPDAAQDPVSEAARDALMANAPARSGGLYLVPTVIE